MIVVMETTEPSRDYEREVAWGVAKRREPHWPAALAVVVAMALYIALSDKLTVLPPLLVPGLEAALLVPLVTVHRHRHADEPRWVRPAGLTLTALVSLANAIALGKTVYLLLSPSGHTQGMTGRQLILSAIPIWLTNVIIFGLWYWELDRGGPGMRCRAHHREPDFLFPQMATPGAAKPGWAPAFADYLYVSFTNSTAFSPTDTLPLTVWAKLLMLCQALLSLLTIALVAARAVNILS